MGRSSITFSLPRYWAPSALENELLGGLDGAAQRFGAVGANEAYFDLALARDLGSFDEDDPSVPIIGVARDGALEIGWSDAAGLCSMLVGYGLHLVLVRAQALGRIDDVEGVLRSGRFAEIRGRLAERGEDGFMLQPIRADDAVSVPLSDANEAEQRLWERLDSECVCPACTARSWTASAADELAAALEQGDEAAIPKIARCMVRTPRLLRAAMLAGVHLRASGKRRVRVWPTSVDRTSAAAAASTVPTLAAAAEVAVELRTHARLDVRAAAYDALVSFAAYEESAASELLARALSDKPKIAEIALVRARAFSPELSREVAPIVLGAIESTKNAEVARAAVEWVVHGAEALDDAARARFCAAIERWKGAPKLADALDAAQRARLLVR